VTATILEPLQAEWANIQAAVEGKRAQGDAKGAAALVRDFHARLCTLRILDPACGTGNFLYVALELMKRLEGEVLEALASLSGDQDALHWLQGQTIDPHQFLGLEINPRAAAIAELVLWIGFLQWHFRTRGGMPPEPILSDFKTIEVRDAVLAFDARELVRDETARPVGRKGAAGHEVPVYRYENPRRPEWPEADFIVGNPPFIGSKYLRERHGDDYATALWAAHPQMNESADFVMYWWDRAAELLTRKGSRLKRFGLVTMNSLSQVFQRRVIDKHFSAKHPVSLVMVVPDHPWTKATRDAAAVRIAMTVAEAGTHEGRLLEVTREAGLETDEPVIELRESVGTINSDLTVGVDVTKCAALQANAFVCSPGVKLHGDGFIVAPSEAEHLGLGRRPGLENHIKPYRNGRDLTGIPRGVMVIDLFGLEADEVRRRFPEVYQHVMEKVKESKDDKGRPNGRDVNNRESYRLNWWIFGEPRRELRPAFEGMPRYIATPVTQKHRTFEFLPRTILPDDALMIIALADAFAVGVLSARIHAVWVCHSSASLGPTPRYIKSRCFDPFPFPDPPEALKAKIRETAEELDALRKRVLGLPPTRGNILSPHAEVLAKRASKGGATVVSGCGGEGASRALSSSFETQASPAPQDEGVAFGSGIQTERPGLTLTQIYNVLEKLRAGEKLDPRDETIKTKGLVLIVKELHERLDALVAAAYGWPKDLTDDEILARLVALNAERAAEERRGLVRWLRPDYQRVRAGVAPEPAKPEEEIVEEQIEAPLVIAAAGKAQKPAFPADDVARTAAVFDMLVGAGHPLDAAAIAARFRQGARAAPLIARILAAWARVGWVHTTDGKSFAIRRVA
jgi:SAM-dependent methyltransferase